MQTLSFPIEKYEGAGNDFIIIDEWEREVIPEKYKSAAVKKLCQRSGSIGADGVLFWMTSIKANGRMRTFNADGSEAEISGNGLRCVARYAYEKREIETTKFTIETMKGVSELTIILDDRGEIDKIKVNMGEPRLLAKDIPMTGDPFRKPIEETILVNDKIGKVKVTALSVGNPHVVIFVKNLEKTNVKSLGKAIECHPFFPERTNVNFVQIENEKSFRIRTFERGVGITLSCGTGTAASTIAGVITGRILSNVEISATTDGGKLWTEYVDDGNKISVYIIGPSRKVFSGNTTIEI